jgi:hypothetical protein
VAVAEAAQKELEHCALTELWTNGVFPSRLTPIESLFHELSWSEFALFIASPEDVTKKRGVFLDTIRDNVLFEIGLFLGRLGRGRVFLISPKGSTNSSLHLPSDLTGIVPAHFDPDAVNLRQAVGGALYEMKAELRSFEGRRRQPIFESSTNLDTHLVVKGGRRWNAQGTEPISAVGSGSYAVTDGILVLERSNTEGVFEVELRPQGADEPTIPRVANCESVYQIEFEAKVDGSNHIVRAICASAKDFRWLCSHEFNITQSDWKPYRAPLKAPNHIDLLIRLDTEVNALPSGLLHLRNMRVTRLQPEYVDRRHLL